ncbi:hypothetical protein [Streptomyces griseoaurantiacus]|uniref:hypothetical protein n=1 Tax=Streptomyces griseoaurantiacus TaxID=68213 RepID=UPI00346165A3
MSAPPTAARAPVRHERTPAAARHPDTTSAPPPPPAPPYATTPRERASRTT